jgi:hypothetical protein
MSAPVTLKWVKQIIFEHAGCQDFFQSRAQLYDLEDADDMFLRSIGEHPRRYYSSVT